MLIIEIKKGDSIENALKKFKIKFKKNKIVEQLRNRTAYEKPSVKKRNIKKKAIYIQKLRDQEIN